MKLWFRLRRRIARRQRAAGFALALAAIAAISGCKSVEPMRDVPFACTSQNTVTADVVALEHVITYNRFGAFNPAGMVYALRHDVVRAGDGNIDGKPLPGSGDMLPYAGRVKLAASKRARPLVLRVNEGECLKVRFTNLLTPQQSVHRAVHREGFPPGMVADHALNEGSTSQELIRLPSEEDSDTPRTRHASMHVNGLEYLDIRSDGSNVGRNPSSLVAPGKSATYLWVARKQGTYFMYSTGALAGGEGDGGQLGLGLFGAVNVEPRGSLWYRSQVTHDQIAKAGRQSNGGIDYARLDYSKLSILDSKRRIRHSDLNAVIVQTDRTSESPEQCKERAVGSSCGMNFREFTVIFHDENKVFQAFAELEDESHPISKLGDGMAINYVSAGVGAPVLANRRKLGPAKECIECKLEEFFLSSWANGDPGLIVERNTKGEAVEAYHPDDPSNVHHAYLGDPVRFRNIHAGPKETHVFHLHAHQWLRDMEDANASYLDSQTISPGSTINYEIHYGGGGNRNYTVGDAIFHCHLYPHFAAGMWGLWRNHDVFEDGAPGLYNPQDRDKEGRLRYAADERNDDFRARNLPDGEIRGGTPNPAVVPIPGFPLPPLPSKDFQGYPFYIAGEVGHRPPQPPLDHAKWKPDGVTEEVLDGGLPRHVILKGESKTGDQFTKPDEIAHLLAGRGVREEGKANGYIAERTFRLSSDPRTIALHAEITSAQMRILPEEGTCAEQVAMAFHAGGVMSAAAKARCGEPVFDFHGVGKKTADAKSDWPNGWTQRGFDHALWSGAGYDSKVAAMPAGTVGGYPYAYGTRFRVNGLPPAPGAPYADPCPGDTPLRKYRAAYLQIDLPVNQTGWHDPQARLPLLEGDLEATLDRTRLVEPLFFRANSNDCVQFEATNLIPSVLNLDDFQVLTPTDVIGQHIHLVKFDVTASDGSANGWNYEDGTLAADEVRERIRARNKAAGKTNLMEGAKVHRIFRDGTIGAADLKALGGAVAGTPSLACPPQPEGTANHDYDQAHPWCGAQSTVQRWWADPMLNNVAEQKDRTLRAVFTHDHYGPSSHQQHGFYAALVIEPSKSVWTRVGSRPQDIDPDSMADCSRAGSGAVHGLLGGSRADGAPIHCRADGGPTGWAANIGFPDSTVAQMSPKEAAASKGETRREYNIAFADFAIVYDEILRPVNPPSRSDEAGLPTHITQALKPAPEGISAEDPGTRLLNYRNEPAPLRIGERSAEAKTPGDEAEGFSFQYRQRENERGDLGHLFSSITHENSDDGLLDSHAPEALADKIAEAYPSEVIDQARRDELAKILEDTKSRRDDLRKLIGVNEPWRMAGDPSTPVLGAYEGDPIKLHLIQGAQEEQHVFSMSGMKWKMQPKSPNSGWMNGQPIGISEHFEFDVDLSNDRSRTTDYWYGSSAVENVWDGMWGLLRAQGWNTVQGTTVPVNRADIARIRPTPPHIDIASALDATCPRGPTRRVTITAWLASDLLGAGGVTYNAIHGIRDPHALMFVELTDGFLEANGLTSGGSTIDSHWIETARKALMVQYQERGKPIEPLVLRARAGDCLDVTLVNLLPERFEDGRNSTSDKWSFNLVPPIVEGLNFNDVRSSSTIGLSPQLLTIAPHRQSGFRLGRNDGVVQAEDPDLFDPSDLHRSVAVGCRTVVTSDGVVRPDWKSCDQVRESSHVASYRWYAGDRTVLDDPAVSGESDKPCAEVADDGQPCLAKRTSRGAIRYLPIEYGAVGLRNFGDPIKHSSHGGIGALIVEPAGATWTLTEAQPQCRKEVDDMCASRLSARVTHTTSFKEFVLLFQDDLSLQQHGQPMPNHRMADDAEDTGQKGFNYRSDPLWARNGVGTSGADFNTLNDVDYTCSLSGPKDLDGRRCSGELAPTFQADAGEAIRFRLVHPAGHSRQHAFVLHGHNWLEQPWIADSSALAIASRPSMPRTGVHGGMGPGTHFNLLTCAGGINGVAGDFLFRAQENFQFHGGLWGVLRVNPTDRPSACPW